MRASELLATAVVDADGRDLGPVHDIRVTGADDGFAVAGLVVGGGGLLAWMAHAWGYAEGRAQGPVVLRALTAPAARRARFVPADRVVEWSPRVRLDCRADDLRPLREEVGG